jgi:hypothetical protein
MATRIKKTKRQPRSTFYTREEDPLAKPPCVGAQAQAEMWLRWDCARQGIEFPEGKVLIDFHANGSRGLAVVCLPLSRVRDLTPGIELLRRDIPAWAMPTTRADLFDVALQTGKPLSDCLSFGLGHYGRNTDYAATDGEIWDRMQANQLLDNAFRDRTFYTPDSIQYRQWQDAADMEAKHEIEQDRLDYEAANANRVAA